jgi:hypothetical protein
MISIQKYEGSDPINQYMTQQQQEIMRLEREGQRLDNLLREVRHELRLREIELAHWRDRAVRAESGQ